ncbi:probable purine permease 11 isoform X1 [Rhododendron vialii]|uniref:probable purine permease 11 isoform X1 n=1 Tax=Rhododendron vialii TaxID=182163 RepID=UPI00265F93D8|nr:probable purine permease 11 isoform X1 [Rhododendron vialii]
MVIFQNPSSSRDTYVIISSYTDNQEPLLIKDGASTDHESHFLRPMGRQWWVLASLNILFLLSGQTAGVILGRFYYDEGGSSTWMATLIQTAAFPILLIPYFIILPSSQNPSTTSTPPSIAIISFVYFALGILFACDNMLYSIGLLYLSASTFSLICATQLVFNAIFAFFINSQKFTVLIMNSVVVLTLSASLVGLNNNSDAPSGVSKWNYFLGFASTVGASALYSLLLSLTQLWFQKVLKKETFSVVLEIQIFASLVATCISVVGLFASGEWKSLKGEVDGFGKGRVAYVMTLVGAAIAWQVCSVGVVGLIFVVSSLFSNVIGTLSLALTPIVAVIVFHDAMNGIKVIALLLSLWGFSTYIYQNYLEDLKVKVMQTEVNEASNHSSC